ncbi:MAG TPA: phosphotransferase family protein [Myxococcota bacterium]|nr:phosphotransferase family protein [Myxococcota bacterium]
MSDTLEDRLARFLSARLGDADTLRVVRLERSTEGFSQETFRFDVELVRGGAREVRSYVAKREPPAGLLEPYDLEPEFRVLHALSDDPLPSPPTPFFERDPAVLERPFYVMECLPGEVPVPAPSADGSGPLSDAERRALAPEIARALARLHAIDWKAAGLGFLGAPAPGTDAARREVERWAERVRRADLPAPPVLAEALLWLRSHLPSADEVTLVHGDFRIGNWLIERAGEGTRLTGLLDWEMVHLGDPLEDLAWCSCLLWRAGGPNASCLVPPEELATLYAEASGRKVDPARVHFYEVLALVKMSAIMLTGIRAFRDGRTSDLRMAIFDHQLPFLMAGLAMLRGHFAAAGGS